MLKIYLVSLSYLLIVTVVVRCKPEYLFNNEAGGWLKLHVIPATWQEAYLRCHYEGAVLASPLNKKLANALHSKVTQSGVNTHIFLGTHDFNSKGHFASVDGVPLSDMEIKWGSRGAGTGDCLTMFSDNETEYHMSTSLCEDSRPFICYRKFDNQRTNECGTFDNEYHFNQHTGSCYKVHQKIQTWQRAYGICVSEGGYLVILNNEEEAGIIKDMFPVNDTFQPWDCFHVGLRAWGDDRIWYTIHGEAVENVYNYWTSDQHNMKVGNNEFASFERYGALRDQFLENKAMFVCEKSPQSIQFEARSPVREE